MRRLALLVSASCALALGAGLLGTSSAQADERSPFQLLGTAARADGSSTLPTTPVRWGWGGGYYRGYGSNYGGYGYRPYGSYYRGGYGTYRPYSSYYRGGYGSYYRPYGSYYGGYRGYGGYYGGYRPGVNLWFGF